MSAPEREREIKLAVPVSFRLPPLTDTDGGVFQGAPETVELDAVYYDTADLRLARAGASLRHRSDDGWTVKLSAASGHDEGLERDEHHFAGDPAAPPDDAVDLVRALIRTAPLERVAELHTTRRRVQIRSLSGDDVATVVDDLVEVVTGATLEPTFREVEVELTAEATSTQVDALLIRLRAASAGIEDPTPKIVRALGPSATAPPDVHVPMVGGPRPYETVVRAAIAECVAQLVAHDPGMRVGEDPEDVHQARVATRRMRSHLGTFKALLDERWVNELRDELRWLGDVLGAVRDAEVLLERLERKVERLAPVDRPAAEKLLDKLRADLVHRREQLLSELRNDRYVALLDRLVLAARRPRLLLRVDDDSDADVLRKLVRKRSEQLDDAVDALGNDPADAQLHEVRIDAKRARYAAEAIAPAFGKPARTFARAITELQDVLGEHQDAVLAAEWLRASAANRTDAVGFAAGQLAGLERQDALEARSGWRAAWKRASRRRLRKWL